MGLEVTSESSIKSYPAATFHNTQLQVANSASGLWHYWTYLDFWHDRPCRAGRPVGECTNGTAVGNTAWYDNKP